MELKDFKMDTNPDISIIHFNNEAEWLELRTRGIGGSDIGILMGLNKYSSPLKLYRTKVEHYVEDMSSNVFIKKGKDLEDLILTNYVQPHFKEQGYTVMKPDFMMTNTTVNPYFRANVDGIAVKDAGMYYLENFIVEIKWVSEYAEVNWRGSEYCGVPASYYAQVQLYMAVTGLQKAVVCALFDKSWTVEYFEIPRNEDFIIRMEAITNLFVRNHLEPRIPPRVHPLIDKEDTIKAIEKVNKDDTPKTPDKETSKLVHQYLDTNTKIKNLTQIKDNLLSKIMEKYSLGFIPDDDTISVKGSIVTSKRFNSTKFKNDHMDLYNQYCEESVSSRFNIK